MLYCKFLPVLVQCIRTISKHIYGILHIAVCDAQHYFTLVDIGYYGRHSDVGVLNHSNFGQALSIPESYNLPCTIALPFVFVGDAVFLLKSYMSRPYPGRYLENQPIYNCRLSRVCRVIENILLV